MRALLLMIVVVLATASLAFAQGDIALFGDVGGTSCQITDAPGIVNAYVFHIDMTGSTASQWRVQSGPGATLTYLAATTSFPLVIGNPQAGVSIAYGGCLGPPVALFTLIYSGTGTSAACSELQLVPDPGAPTGQVETVNCSAQKRTKPNGRHAFINNDGSCNTCPGPVTPVEESSWGKVKALYQ